jgi:hypothetical protein
MFYGSFETNFIGLPFETDDAMLTQMSQVESATINQHACVTGVLVY